jgi:excisionase family DNA binding protein
MATLATTKEIAELLGVSEVTVRNYAEAGRIPTARRTLGGHRRFDVDAVRAEMAEGAEALLWPPSVADVEEIQVIPGAEQLDRPHAPLMSGYRPSDEEGEDDSVPALFGDGGFVVPIDDHGHATRDAAAA